MWCPRSLGAAAGVLLLCLVMVVAVTSQNVNNIRPISRSLRNLFRLLDHDDHDDLHPTIRHVLPAHPWHHPWRHVHPPLSPVYGHYPYSLWHHPHSLSPYTPHPYGPFHHDPVRVLALQSPGHVYPHYHHHHHHHGHAYYPHHHRHAYYPYYPSWHGPYRYPHAHAYYPYPHAPAYYPPHPVPYHPWQPHYHIPPVPYYPYHPIVANYGHIPVNASYYPVPFYPHYPMTPTYSPYPVVPYPHFPVTPHYAAHHDHPIAPVHPPYAQSPYVPVPHPPYAPYAHIHPAYPPHPSAPYAPAPYWPPDYIHMWPLHPDTYHAWTQEGGCSWERPFPCWGVGTCIPISAVCDKQYDCGNYLDEDSRLCVSGKRPSVHLMQMFFALPAQSWMENKLFNNRDSYYVAVAFKFALTMADLKWALTLSEEAVNNTKAAFTAADADDKAPMNALGMKDEDWPITKYLFKTLTDTGFVVS